MIYLPKTGKAEERGISVVGAACTNVGHVCVFCGCSFFLNVNVTESKLTLLLTARQVDESER